METCHREQGRERKRRGKEKKEEEKQGEEGRRGEGRRIQELILNDSQHLFFGHIHLADRFRYRIVARAYLDFRKITPNKNEGLGS